MEAKFLIQLSDLTPDLLTLLDASSIDERTDMLINNYHIDKNMKPNQKYKNPSCITYVKH